MKIFPIRHKRHAGIKMSYLDLVQRQECEHLKHPLNVVVGRPQEVLVEVERGGEVAAQPDGVAARRFPNLNKNEFKLKYLNFFQMHGRFPTFVPLEFVSRGTVNP